MSQLKVYVQLELQNTIAESWWHVSEDVWLTLAGLYQLTDSFFDRSTDHIYLLLMQEICRQPGISMDAGS